jgi:hypothetical protein
VNLEPTKDELLQWVRDMEVISKRTDLTQEEKERRSAVRSSGNPCHLTSGIWTRADGPFTGNGEKARYLFDGLSRPARMPDF